MADFKVEGLKELLAAMKALPPAFGSKGGGPIKGALFATTKMMREVARSKAPKATGRLARNVIAFRDSNPRLSGLAEAYYVTFRRGKRGKGKHKRYNTKAGSDKDAFYGRFVEFGTSKMPAQPFLRPAFEETKTKAVEMFKTELAKKIDSAVKRARRGG